MVMALLRRPTLRICMTMAGISKQSSAMQNQRNSAEERILAKCRAIHIWNRWYRVGRGFPFWWIFLRICCVRTGRCW